MSDDGFEEREICKCDDSDDEDNDGGVEEYEGERNRLGRDISMRR